MLENSDVDHAWQRYAVYKYPPKEILRPFLLPGVLTDPGHGDYPSRVLDAFDRQLLGHLHPKICQLMDEVKVGLQYAFQTKNRLTLPLSTSGNGGMEACLGNLLESGDTVLIAKCGIWGERAADVADRIGAKVEFLETDCGVAFELKDLEAALKRCRPAVVFVTHAESSTGMKQPLEGVGELVRKYDALLIVDTVASLGGDPFFMDAWLVDATYTGSQKVLGAPPGITPISFSPRAENKIFQRKTKPSAFYRDMRILGNHWNCFGEKRVYHTINTTLMYGLRMALTQLAEEGLPACWARHAAAAARFTKGLESRGLQCYVEDPRCQSSTVVSIKLPAGVDATLVATRAWERCKVEINGDLGPAVDKILRVSLMGNNAQPSVVDLVLRVLDEGLQHAVVSKL